MFGCSPHAAMGRRCPHRDADTSRSSFAEAPGVAVAVGVAVEVAVGVAVAVGVRGCGRGCSVSGSPSRALGLGFSVSSSRFPVLGLELSVSGSRSRALGSRSRSPSLARGEDRARLDSVGPAFARTSRASADRRFVGLASSEIGAVTTPARLGHDRPNQASGYAPSTPQASRLRRRRRVLHAVKAAHIRDTKLRDEALRAAKGACLNCAEGAGRVSRADKARVFAIARGEVVEAVAAVEIAAHAGDTTQEAAERCVVIGNRVVALLTGFIR
jgi:four helix bundle protein